MRSSRTHFGHTLPLSLDDLIRPHQERPRNREAERLGTFGGVLSDDDSSEQTETGRHSLESPERPMRQE